MALWFICAPCTLFPTTAVPLDWRTMVYNVVHDAVPDAVPCVVSDAVFDAVADAVPDAVPDGVPDEHGAPCSDGTPPDVRSESGPRTVSISDPTGLIDLAGLPVTAPPAVLA